jgi:capsular polysaccharide biosynthesis protein
MDLSLHLRVLWRFKIVLAVGIFVALFLALLAATKASAKTWKSDATLFVTQPGFPWGRTVIQYLPGNTATGKPSVPTADPQRLSSLTALYAQLATSDPVAPWLKGVERRHEQLTVTAVPAPQYSTPTLLPLLQIEATAPSKARAMALANRASTSFRTWLAQQQATAEIPPAERVVVEPISRADTAQRVGGSGKTLPVIVFLAVLAATIGVIFVLENLRAGNAADAADTDDPARLSDWARRLSV